MVTAWRWLLAASVVPLVLAGCTSSAGPPGAGTGTASRPAVRHVWVIELENYYAIGRSAPRSARHEWCHRRRAEGGASTNDTPGRNREH